LPRWDNCAFLVPNPHTLNPFACIQRSWAIAREAAGLPEVRIRDFRHFSASNLVSSVRSVCGCAGILGHSQLKTSQRPTEISRIYHLELGYENMVGKLQKLGAKVRKVRA